MANNNQMLAVKLTVATVLGIVLAIGSQIIVSHQTAKSGPDLCVGPAVIGYSCPGSQTQTIRRGFPVAFNIQYKTIKTGGFHFDEASAVPSVSGKLSAGGFLCDSLLYALAVFAVLHVLTKLWPAQKR